MIENGKNIYITLVSEEIEISFIYYIEQQIGHLLLPIINMCKGGNSNNFDNSDEFGRLKPRGKGYTISPATVYRHLKDHIGAMSYKSPKRQRITEDQRKTTFFRPSPSALDC